MEYFDVEARKGVYDRMHIYDAKLTGIYRESLANLNAYIKGEKEPLGVPVYMTGDIEFDGCDVTDYIKAKTTTGDIEGSFRSDKIIFARSNTGDIDVPRHTDGESCELTTTTGDIKIKIKK